MGRPSTRVGRRRELALAFERVLAAHGVGGATIAAVAAEAGVAPGLVHHHFRDREDLVLELVRALAARFRGRLTAGCAGGAPPSGAQDGTVDDGAVDDVAAWIDAALAPAANTEEAGALRDAGPHAAPPHDRAPPEPRAWVGLLAEGIQSRPVGELLRRALTAELDRLERLFLARGLSPGEARDRAAGLLALTVGALVVGTVVPGWAPGFSRRVAVRLVGQLPSAG